MRDGGEGEREAARRETVARPITCARRGVALIGFMVAGLPIRSLRFGRARYLGKAEARATPIARALFFQAARSPFIPLRFRLDGRGFRARAARSLRT